MEAASKTQLEGAVAVGVGSGGAVDGVVGASAGEGEDAGGS